MLFALEAQALLRGLSSVPQPHCVSRDCFFLHIPKSWGFVCVVKDQKSSFKLSFTSLALGLQEASAALNLYRETGDWDQAAIRAVEKNVLQKNNSASTRRIFREIRQRLQTLDEDTLNYFLDANTEDQKAILLIAACKCYPFLFDFIRITLADKYTVFDYRVGKEDFDTYWNRSSLEHPSLEEVSDSTRLKIRQVTFRLLAEAGLLSSTKDPQITPIQLSSMMLTILGREGNLYCQAFLN
jgi:hypothetical protein